MVLLRMSQALGQLGPPSCPCTFPRSCRYTDLGHLPCQSVPSHLGVCVAGVAARPVWGRRLELGCQETVSLDSNSPREVATMWRRQGSTPPSLLGQERWVLSSQDTEDGFAPALVTGHSWPGAQDPVPCPIKRGPKGEVVPEEEGAGCSCSTASPRGSLPAPMTSPHRDRSPGHAGPPPPSWLIKLCEALG